ncbi:Uncharacterised protein [Burkholderia pseudomallei]|uniref:hypothetical protein n=1 Tax=Burkholderia pseudomallei TaxID=28450 RepID=UPI00052A7D7F|nr:hypothetical protein [Burkholderia pseudomallei]AIV76661.1 hypothetical protein X994_1402 [Burkholderia pseudomallei]MBD2919375.1 hypothetical protein [Burkholderia pseudomallei]MBD2998476.1 hypothetical protein [Burkholderia pseudomallei]MBF3753900.1 hypothetical protein [Burkholderia pseudomallei]MBF4086990.1 hypothetical protein [Burkholderia pseudomallei]
MSVEKPLHDIKDAYGYLEEMRTAKTYHAYDRAWVNLLGALSRAWHRTGACIKPFPNIKYSALVDEATKLIGEGGDELLVYLRMARNVREHGLEDITTHAPGRVEIGPPDGSNVTYVRHMEIRGGKITKLDAPNGAKIEFKPGRVIPTSIKVGGKEYPLPKTHLGKPILSSDAAVFGLLGIVFYEQTINSIGSLLQEAT